MRNLFIIASLLVVNLAAAQQPARLTEKFFPDPDTVLTTPAFESPMGFTKYKELISFLEDLSTKSEHFKIEYIGETQKGRKIPVVLISKPSSQNKVKVWMQGGIHGNEPASSEGMLTVLQSLATNPSRTYLLDKLDIAIAPMINIDGYMKQNRMTKNGLDLNRDLMKLQLPETQQLKRYYSQYSAHVTIDFHEYNPFRSAFRQLGSMGVTSYYDAMFLYSGALNVNPKIRELTNELFVKSAKSDFDRAGYTHHDYFSAKDNLGKLYFNLGSTSARSSATSCALSNSVSILMEIRGVNLNRKSFERRVLITQEAAFSFFNTAYSNSETVLEDINGAIESTIALEEDVVAKSQKNKITAPIKFIDFGENEILENQYEIAATANLQPTITRTRPYAYVLTSDQIQAVENLKILGLEVEKISSQTLKVETYLVTSQQVDPMKYQGYFPNKVQVQVDQKHVDFPDGSYIVRLDQKNANLAVVALEPENSDGFVKTRVIEASLGDEIPVYRLMKPIVIGN